MLICEECLCTYDDDVIIGGSCPQRNCEGRIVNIDQHMIPICTNLWKKGYGTTFSCEGHIDVNSFPYITITIDKERCEQLGITFPDFSYTGTDKKIISLSCYNQYENHISFKDIDDGILNKPGHLIHKKFSDTISQIRKFIDKMRKYESIMDIRIHIMSDKTIEIQIVLRSAIQVNGCFYPMEEVTLDFYKRFLEYKFFYLKELIDLVEELPDLNEEGNLI